MKRAVVTSAVAIALSTSLLAATAGAQDRAPSPAAPQAGLVDVGARFGVARHVGAFDAGTHASDVAFGAVPFALDATARIPTGSSWSIAAGGLFAYALTIPTLCTDTSTCISSIGHDIELVALARVRAPKLAFVWPEGEIGTGWSWSSRSLVDKDATSTRRWNGPVLVRAALVPTVRLGAHTRLGVVIGGSIARSSSFTLEAPGVERHGIEGARIHGTLDLGVRLGVDLGS